MNQSDVVRARLEPAGWPSRSPMEERRLRDRTSSCFGAAPRRWLALALAGAGFGLNAQDTNPPAPTNAAAAPPPLAAIQPTNSVAKETATAPQKLDEAAFRIIAERNIFNANRSGGRVQLPSSRPRRVETFALVGTMAYERGAFAFFDGSSSEFSKVARTNDVIAGHKVVDVLPDGVKLEADGKQFVLRVGTGMKREEAGAWQVAETVGGGGGGGYADSRNGDSNRSSRSSRGSDAGRSRREESREGSRGPTPPATAGATVSEAEKNEALKRLLERREKE